MTSAHWTFVLTLFPIIGGLVIWVKSREIVLWEWATSVGVATLLIYLTFLASECTMSNDAEVFSGKAYQACHTPKWRAEWIERVEHTSTDSKGNTTTTYTYETRSETHHPRWWLETTIGRITVDESTYESIARKHGEYKERGHRPDFDSGDRYDYFSDVDDDPDLPDYPVHQLRRWSNPLLGTDTIKLGKPVSVEEANHFNLHHYPKVGNAMRSTRVIGADIDTYKWDQMCATLGPEMKVNLIIIDFSGRDMSMAVKQRDYWRNGRKNDLVLCYGDGWAYVFGWSKNELVKQELQTLLLDNRVDDNLIPKISAVIRRDFKPYEWKQHDDTPRPVNPWAVVVAIVLMLGSQVGLYVAFHGNYSDKSSFGP